MHKKYFVNMSSSYLLPINKMLEIEMRKQNYTFGNVLQMFPVFIILQMKLYKKKIYLGNTRWDLLIILSCLNYIDAYIF